MSSEKSEIKTLRVGVEDITNALKLGLPLTCSTCVHYYAACALGQQTCGKILCGGPIVGRDFPEYKGQLSKERLATICLMCGSLDVEYKVITSGKSQTFALCSSHKDTFKDILISPECPIPQVPPIVIPIKL